MHAKKELQKSPEHTSEHVKSLSWGVPQTLIHTMGPLFVFSLGPSISLGGRALDVR